MAEKEKVIDELRLQYEGLFDINELYHTIDRWFREKQYDKREIKNVEFVKPEGKYVELWLMPWKKITDYAKIEIKIRLIIENLKEVEVEKDNHKVKMNQGTIKMVIDGFLTTDYENKWEGKPTYVFIRTLFDKFIYKGYTSRFKGQVSEDVNHFHTTLKSFLNLYRF
jgi:hypothetical protein